MQINNKYVAQFCKFIIKSHTACDRAVKSAVKDGTLDSAKETVVSFAKATIEKCRRNIKY